jgi:hypothetical protein
MIIAEELNGNVIQYIQNSYDGDVRNDVNKQFTMQLMLIQQYRSFVDIINHPLKLVIPEVGATSQGQELDLLILSTESRKGILMGYSLFKNKEIPVNQNSLTEAEKCANQKYGKALMDKNQLMNIYVINWKQNEEKSNYLDCDDVNCKSVELINMNDSRISGGYRKLQLNEKVLLFRRNEVEKRRMLMNFVLQNKQIFYDGVVCYDVNNFKLESKMLSSEV